MKKQDIVAILVVLAIFLPFFLSTPLYEFYLKANGEHPYLLAFLKFGILATMGEMLACRIRAGYYCNARFGVVPKALVWGLLGMWIALAMKVFSAGIPIALEKIGFEGQTAAMMGGFSWLKLWGAFCISVMMNTSFAPVFMTLHKITDTHITKYNGQISCLVKPIKIGETLANLDWKVQWNFVFKKTIPLFWIPAHTITFILPQNAQVLFAALLGAALGLILAIAARK